VITQPAEESFAFTVIYSGLQLRMTFAPWRETGSRWWRKDAK
jgi:hypothetical protein